MAIDYGNYAQTYGQGLDLSPIQRGISNYMEKSKEALSARAGRENEDAWAGFMQPWQTAMSADVDSWSADTFKMDDAGTALKNYKERALKKGNKFYNTLASQGAFNPITFKEQYDQLKTTYMPQIERKLETYQKMNHKSDKEMKEFIESKGMNEFLLNYGSEAGSSREWAMPHKSWGDWWKEKGGIAGTGGDIATVGFGASAVGSMAPSTIRGVRRGPLPLGLGRKAPEFSQSQLEKLGSKMKDKIGKGLESAVKGNVSQAEAKLSRAQDLFDTAKKNYKGKNFASTTKGPNSAKALKANINAAKSGLNKVQSKVGQGSMKVIQRYVKQHGTKKLLKVLGKKYGIMGATRLALQLGLGTFASASVVGTAAGAALNFYTLYQVAQALTSLSE